MRVLDAGIVGVTVFFLLTVLGLAAIMVTGGAR